MGSALECQCGLRLICKQAGAMQAQSMRAASTQLLHTCSRQLEMNGLSARAAECKPGTLQVRRVLTWQSAHWWSSSWGLQGAVAVHVGCLQARDCFSIGKVARHACGL